MSLINLKKVIYQKELRLIVDQFMHHIDHSICIQQANGKILIGKAPENKNVTHQYPIELAGELVGWVIGDQKSAMIASLISYAVKQEAEKKSLANELLEKYQEIDLFQDISTQINASLDLQEVAQFVIQEAVNLLDSTNGSIFRLNPQTNQLEELFTSSQICYLQQSLILGKGIISSMADTGQGEIINDVASDPRFKHFNLPVSSLICVPLKTEEQVVGVIIITNEKAINYTTEHLKILTLLASQAATAIEKALLYQKSCKAAQQAQQQAQQLQRTLEKLQQTQAQLVQSEKMSSLGQMIAGIAHEINNPVNFIHGNLNYAHDYIQDLLNLIELYQQHYPEPNSEIEEKAEEIDLCFLMKDFPDLISSMKIGANRIKEIVVSLRNFSRLGESEKKPVDIHNGIESTLLILNNRLKENSNRDEIQVIKKYSELPLVDCYARQLNQVFMNIISNAIDAMEEFNQPPQHLMIQISTQMINSDWVAIRIIDNGPGIPKEVIQKIYDPFFTTKPVGKGTGLGMAISHQIVVEKHGGILKCHSQKGKGTEFLIQIPIIAVSYEQSTPQQNLPLLTQV
jgi:signal transduction histidine kinase